MAKKPANLVYAVDEAPGWGTSLLLGLQHICVQSISFIIPVLLMAELGGTPEQTENLICMAMVASGVATILQGLHRGPVGSGYLAPIVNGPAFLAASLLAGAQGGLALISGMTLVAGIAESLFSRVVTRMRPWFPAEVTGTVVTMVGIEIIAVAVPRFLGVDARHPAPTAPAVITALVTLMSMVGFNVWGRRWVRLYAVLLGIGVGYVMAWALGCLTWAEIKSIGNQPLLKIPRFGAYGWSFEWVMLVPFLIAALSSALKTMGDLSTCQKINDADWKRPDLGNISRGILACGVGNLVSGAIGAVGQSISSSNIGLAMANGVTSRRVAYTNGGILITLAFVPVLAYFFVIMPSPVMGACLIFAVSFMIVAGIQIITSRMLDARKTFVVGTSIIFGLSVDLAPAAYQHVHPWLKPIFSSSLSLTALCAVALNLVLRIGIARHQRLTLHAGTDAADTIFAFMEKQGAAWGARREVVYNAMAAINEFMEAAALLDLKDDRVDLEVSFDEFNLDARITYQGPPLEFPDVRPDKAALRADPTAAARLAGYLVRQYADKVSLEREGPACHVLLHFDH